MALVRIADDHAIPYRHLHRYEPPHERPAHAISEAICISGTARASATLARAPLILFPMASMMPQPCSN